MGQNHPKIVEARTEERPRYFDFRKSALTGFHPTMANLTYDPFPNAKNDDVVRTEIIARQLVLHAKLKGPFDSIKQGTALNYQGYDFGLVEVTEQINTESDECLFEVEGVAFLTPGDPFRTLSLLRDAFAASNSR